MPSIFTGDGQGWHVPNVPYATLRTILFERVTTSLPAGVTKSGGNPPTWVQFAPPATGSTAEGQTFTITPDGTVALVPS
jgi:hypothetical protein